MAQRNIFTLLSTEEEKAATARDMNIEPPAPKVSTQEPPAPSLAKRIQGFIKEQNFKAAAELITQAPTLPERANLMCRAAFALSTDLQLREFFCQCMRSPQYEAIMLASSDQMLADADAVVLRHYLDFLPRDIDAEIHRKACGLKRERFDLFVRTLLFDFPDPGYLSAVLRKEIYSRYGSGDSLLRKHYTPDGETLFPRICDTSNYGLVRVRVWNDTIREVWQEFTETDSHYAEEDNLEKIPAAEAAEVVILKGLTLRHLMKHGARRGSHAALMQWNGGLEVFAPFELEMTLILHPSLPRQRVTIAGESMLPVHVVASALALSPSGALLHSLRTLQEADSSPSHLLAETLPSKNTPLHLVCQAASSLKVITEALAILGPNEVRNRAGRTPLELLPADKRGMLRELFGLKSDSPALPTAPVASEPVAPAMTAAAPAAPPTPTAVAPAAPAAPSPVTPEPKKAKRKAKKRGKGKEIKFADEPETKPAPKAKETVAAKVEVEERLPPIKGAFLELLNSVGAPPAARPEPSEPKASVDAVVGAAKAEPIAPASALQQTQADSAVATDIGDDSSDVRIDSLDGLPWEVALSLRAIRALEALPPVQRKTVLNKLVFLANGNRSVNTAKALEGSADGLVIFETYLLHGWRMVWQVVIEFSTRSSAYTDMILVWDIVSHDRVSAVVGYLNHRLKNSVADRRKYKAIGDLAPTTAGEAVPRTYKVVSGEEGAAAPAAVAAPKAEEKKAVEQLLASNNAYILEKFYTLSSEVAAAVLRDTPEKEYVFHISEEEAKVVATTANTLLLGRSGTGKTTCAVLRLWSAEREYRKAAALAEGPLLVHTHGAAATHMHQMFVTVSHNLCHHVRKNLHDLNRTYSEKNIKASESRLFNVPTDMAQLTDESFPLVVPFTHFLYLLDSLLPLAERFFAQTDASAARTEAADALREQYGWRATTEERVLTSPTQRGPALRSAKSIVEYEHFERVMWPRITKSKTFKSEWRGRFHPALVYTEIMSFIRGSTQALDTDKGELSLEQYEALGQKMSPAFASLRAEIYQLYQLYKALKVELRVYDKLDPIHHIYRFLKRHSYRGPPIHRIFVDEVQDFTQAELKLFFMVCSAPQNGFFFAGDTAQTIERGVGFRFADLRSLFYEEKQPVPSVWQLTRNFRSHAGILNLASSVVDVLEALFPLSIDRLKRDNGAVLGPAPVVIQATHLNEFALYLLGKETGQAIEFGAHQVIIVRSEESKEKLPPSLRHGLVMTPLEAKGLEFEDVFVCNFFHDSPESANWNALEEFLATHTPPLGQQGGTVQLKFDEMAAPEVSPSALVFQADKDRVLCTELKSLYMCLTRAKRNLWIFDTSQRGTRLQRHWLMHGLAISSASPEFKERERLLRKSSRADWRKQGFVMLERRLLKLAVVCFENSGDELMRNKCMAALEADNAWYLHSTDPKEAQAKFRAAAHAWRDAGEPLLSAQCFVSAGESTRAASQFEFAKEWASAAACWEHEKRHDRAVDAYVAAADFTSALRCCRGAQMPLMTIELLERHGAQIDAAAAVQEAMWAAKHLKNSDRRRMMELLVRFLPNEEERLAFLRREKCTEEYAARMQSLGRFAELGDFYRLHEDYEKAGDCFARCKPPRVPEASKMYVRAYDTIRARAQSAPPAQYGKHVEHAAGLMDKAMQLPLEGDADIATIDFRLEIATLLKGVAKLRELLALSKSKGYLLGEWNAIDALLNVWWESPLSTEEMTLRLRYLELVGSMLRTLRAAIKRQRHDPTMLSFCEIVLGMSPHANGKSREFSSYSELANNLRRRTTRERLHFHIRGTHRSYASVDECYVSAVHVLSSKLHVAALETFSRLDATLKKSAVCRDWLLGGCPFTGSVGGVCERPHMQMNQELASLRLGWLIAGARAFNLIDPHLSFAHTVASSHDASQLRNLISRFLLQLMEEVHPSEHPMLSYPSVQLAVALCFFRQTVHVAVSASDAEELRTAAMQYARGQWVGSGPTEKKGLQNGTTPLQVWRILSGFCSLPDVFLDLLEATEKVVPKDTAGLLSGRYLYRLLSPESDLPMLTRISAFGQLFRLLRTAKHPLYASPSEVIYLFEMVFTWLLYAHARHYGRWTDEEQKQGMLPWALCVSHLHGKGKAALRKNLYDQASFLGLVDGPIGKTIEHFTETIVSYRGQPLPLTTMYRILLLLRVLEMNLKATLATSAVREVFRDWCFREGPSFRVNAASSITKFEALKLLVEGDPTHCYAAAIRFLSVRGVVFVLFTPRAAEPKVMYYENSSESDKLSDKTDAFVAKLKRETETGPSPPQSAATLVALIRDHWQKREVSVEQEAAPVVKVEAPAAAAAMTAAATAAARNAKKREKKKKDVHPRRPGQRPCLHWVEYGFCGFGRDCMFDHPPPKEETDIAVVAKPGEQSRSAADRALAWLAHALPNVDIPAPIVLCFEEIGIDPYGKDTAELVALVREKSGKVYVRVEELEAPDVRDLADKEAVAAEALRRQAELLAEEQKEVEKASLQLAQFVALQDARELARGQAARRIQLTVRRWLKRRHRATRDSELFPDTLTLKKGHACPLCNTVVSDGHAALPLHTKNSQVYSKVVANYKQLVALRAKLPKLEAPQTSAEARAEKRKRNAEAEEADEGDDEEEMNAELSELTSHTSDAYLRHMVYVKGALAVGAEVAALLERVDDFLQREQFLLRPTVRAPGPVTDMLDALQKESARPDVGAALTRVYELPVEFRPQAPLESDDAGGVLMATEAHAGQP